MKIKSMLIILSVMEMLCHFNNAKAQKVKQKDLEKVVLKTLKQDDKEHKKVKEIIPYGVKNDTCIYITKLINGGFIILSADYRAEPVLGISYNGDFDINSINPGLQFLIKKYINGINSLKKDDIQLDEETKKEVKQKWDNYLDQSLLKSVTVSSSVNNLLETKWGQGESYPPRQLSAYNRYCPEGCYAGCVAVAMAQILYYWKWDVDQTGSNTYDGQTANFGNSDYCYSQMYKTRSDNVNSKLIYHAGISCNTDYCKKNAGSAATVDNALSAFENYWGFSSDAFTKRRYWINIPTWKSRLKDDLDDGRPVLYSGGDHAWVISGYDSDDKFYCNWGVDGINDGNYSLGDFTPGGEDWNDYEYAIFELHPETEVLHGVEGPAILPSNPAKYTILNKADCINAHFERGPHMRFVYGGDDFVVAGTDDTPYVGMSWIEVTYTDLNGESKSFRRYVTVFEP